jgi:hypothetical protein
MCVVDSDWLVGSHSNLRANNVVLGRRHPALGLISSATSGLAGHGFEAQTKMNHGLFDSQALMSSSFFEM